METFIEILKDYQGLKEWDILSTASEATESGYLCEFAWEHDTYFEHIPLNIAREVSRKYWETIEAHLNPNQIVNLVEITEDWRNNEV